MIKLFAKHISTIGQIKITYLVFAKKDNSQNSQYKKPNPIRKWVSYGSMASISYEFTGFLKIDFSKENINIINLPTHQIGRLVSLFKSTLKVIETKGDKIWYLDKTGTPGLYTTTDKDKYIADFGLILKGLIKNQYIIAIPTLVKDYQEILYEGYSFRLNNNISFDLTTDEIKDVFYILSKTDFITLGQILINSAILWKDETLDTEINFNSDYVSSEDFKKHQEEKKLLNTQPKSTLGSNIFYGLMQKSGGI